MRDFKENKINDELFVEDKCDRTYSYDLSSTEIQTNMEPFSQPR
jgi:hypothetical protein